MKICVGNWKMNGSVETVKMLSEKINGKEFSSTEVIIAVPYTLITQARHAFNPLYKIAAQSICPYAQYGAYTGEISASQVKEALADVVIIGHSERAKYAHETVDQIISQIELSIESGLEVILCVGETEAERNSKRTEEVITNRLKKIKPLLIQRDIRILIAYEPIWSIGTGLVPSNKEIEETLSLIKRETEGYTRGILYGGSVNRSNTKNLLKIPILSGFLIGAASLTDEFIDICEYTDSNN